MRYSRRLLRYDRETLRLSLRFAWAWLRRDYERELAVMFDLQGPGRPPRPTAIYVAYIAGLRSTMPIRRRESILRRDA